MDVIFFRLFLEFFYIFCVICNVLVFIVIVIYDFLKIGIKGKLLSYYFYLEIEGENLELKLRY